MSGRLTDVTLNSYLFFQDMDPRVLQALAQAQLRLTHETGRAFMQSIAPLSIPVTLPTQSFD